MDFRIRKLLPTKRNRAQSKDTDRQSVVYQANQTPTSGHRSIFSRQSLNRSRVDVKKPEEPSVLKAFSYNSTAQGKPPTFGGRPQKGNGPVKLQTGRRLSSGDILVTPQDDQRVLRDVREGEFVVAGKPRRDSRIIQEVPPPSLAMNPTSALYNGKNSPKSISRIASPTWPSTPLSASFGAHSPVPTSELTSSPQPNEDRSKNSTLNDYRDSARSNQKQIHPDGLGISQRDQSPQLNSKTSQISLLEPHEQSNATIQAIWKAEYSRLVKLYGQAGVDKNIAELNRERFKRPITRLTQSENNSRVAVDLIPLKSLQEPKSSDAPQKPGPILYTDPTGHEDNSDESSHKSYSFMSSTGRSSQYTTRTSMAEPDFVCTREDLRKIVDDMRSTYLQAIEARGNFQQTRKSTKKKKRRKSSGNASVKRHSISNVPDVPAMPGMPPTSEKLQARSASTKTVSRPTTSSAPTTPLPRSPLPTSPLPISPIPASPLPTSPTATMHSHRTPRTSSLAASKFKLASIPSSPLPKSPLPKSPTPKDEQEIDTGLKRADSTTLGALMGEPKKSSKQKRNSSVATTATTTTNDEFDLALSSTIKRTQAEQRAAEARTSHNKSPEPTGPITKDFEAIYKELFGGADAAFWQTTSTQESTIGLPSAQPVVTVTKPPPPSSQRVSMNMSRKINPLGSLI